MTDEHEDPDDTACLSLRWALALLRGLVAGGVQHLVLSPGSRSTPLVLAAEQIAGLRLTPVVDERSAAFFALGTARASGRPVALLCTSGSAPAHCHPAVIEAHEWGVPLILLSADRPPSHIGWGANQTTRQQRLFADHLRAFHDPGLPSPHGLEGMSALGRRAATTSRWPDPGPVHINLPFDEPLVPRNDCETADTADTASVAAPAAPLASDAALEQAIERMRRDRGLILCGPAEHVPALPGLHALCGRLDAPVLADPLSGLRFSDSARLPLVTRYDALLRNPGLAQRLRPDWVLRLGRPPVSRVLQEWLDGIPLLLADPRNRWQDPGHDCLWPLPADPDRLCGQIAERLSEPAERTWSETWLQAEQRCDALAGAHLEQADWFEGQLLQTLLPLLPGGASLLVGNSLPIRQLDTWSGAARQALRLFGNRGVSGIDGQSATLAGIAAATEPPVFGLIGDLALFHDLGSLELVRRFHATLLVIDNGGGRIFDYLPQHGLPQLQAHWHTPTDLALDALARTFGIAHHRVADAHVLTEAMAENPDGSARLIEIRVDAEHSRRETLAYWQTVAQDPVLTAL